MVVDKVERETKASNSFGIREFLVNLCFCVPLNLGGIFQGHIKRLSLELFDNTEIVKNKKMQFPREIAMYRPV